MERPADILPRRRRYQEAILQVASRRHAAAFSRPTLRDQCHDLISAGRFSHLAGLQYHRVTGAFADKPPPKISLFSNDATKDEAARQRRAIAVITLSRTRRRQCLRHRKKHLPNDSRGFCV